MGSLVLSEDAVSGGSSSSARELNLKDARARQVGNKLYFQWKLSRNVPINLPYRHQAWCQDDTTNGYRMSKSGGPETIGDLA
jgi:hypothetical protein